MDLSNIEEHFQNTFTKTIHNTGYAAISPSRPELKQTGRNVLITGGGTNIGKSIASNFVKAGAANVIIIGRRLEVLNEAKAELEALAKSTGSPAKILARSVDIGVAANIDKLWSEITGPLGFFVDVVVLNATLFTVYKNLPELGIDKVWDHFNTNVRSALHLAELLIKQKGDKQRFLTLISTSAINSSRLPAVALNPIYSLTKMSATYAVYLLSKAESSDRTQINIFHPGLVYNNDWEKNGVTRDALPFDDVDLAGQFGVWSASKEAAFLHGRFVWNSWDVEELAQIVPQAIKEDPDFLAPGIIGLTKGGKRA